MSSKEQKYIQKNRNSMKYEAFVYTNFSGNTTYFQKLYKLPWRHGTRIGPAFRRRFLLSFFSFGGRVRLHVSYTMHCAFKGPRSPNRHCVPYNNFLVWKSRQRWNSSNQLATISNANFHTQNKRSKSLSVQGGPLIYWYIYQTSTVIMFQRSQSLSRRPVIICN